MRIPLETLTPCFQGLIPASFFTCSKDGVPNCSYLSHVDYVDRDHVALSFQFFNKSRRNIAENPNALIRVTDPDTLRDYALRLRYVRSETSGPLFDSMALRIEAIASHTGLKGIFRLLAADIYEVLAVEECADPMFAAPPHAREGVSAPVPRESRFTLRALQEISDRIHRATSLETLLDSILAAIDELLEFRHSMLLLAVERQDRLVTVASRGYPERGAGAEVGYGEGIIGMVAEARKPIRIAGMIRGMLYAYAVRERATEKGLCPRDTRIPLPGLPDPASQLGIPLLVRGELLGVLCIESTVPYRFHEEDRAYLEVLGSYLAIAIENMMMKERAEDAGDDGGGARPRSDHGTAERAGRREVAFYRGDECILVDGEYLIRSLPAKILWKLLRENRSEGRLEFTNRELRLDKSLNLPEFKDNLESRLLLLRRRLEERCPDIRLVPCARGRFSLDLGCDVDLVERP